MRNRLSLPLFRLAPPAVLTTLALVVVLIAAAPPSAALATPPSGEPADGGIAVATTGLVNAALAAGMGAAQKPSLRDAVSPDSELIRDLVYNADRQQAAAGQRQPYELSLLDAVEMALRNNLNVQISRYSPQQSFNGIMSSRAGFDPQMSFQIPSTFSRGSNPTTSEIDGGAIINSQTLNGGFSWNENLEWGTSYGLNYSTNRSSTNNEFSTINPSIRAGFSGNVTQQLLRGFGEVNRTGIRVAMNGYDSSLEGFRAQVQNILFSTIQAYWNLRSANEQLSINQQALLLAEQQFDRNTIQVEIGTLAPIETVQAETQRENARLTLIQSQNAVENAQDQLRELMNFEAVVDDAFAYDLIPTETPEETIAPIDVEETIRIALDNDPSLAQQRLSLRNAELGLNQARNNLLPALSVRGSFNLSGVAGTRLLGGPGSSETVSNGLGTALGQILSGDFNTWSISATLSMPLHNYSAKANLANSEISQRQQLTSIEARRQELSYDIRQQVRNVENLVQQVATAKLSTELADRQLQAEQRKFEVGTSTNFQVLTFQNQFSQAQLRELQIILNLQSTIAQLERTKGTLLQTFGVQIGDAGTGSGGSDEREPLPDAIGGR